MPEKTEHECTLCGVQPENGQFSITGKKSIDGQLRDYQLCKQCCLELQGTSNPYNNKQQVERQRFWERVVEKLA